MAQINLLSSNTSASQGNIGQTILRLAVKILVVVLAGVIVYYAWLILSAYRTDRSVKILKDKITQSKSEVLALKDRQELIVRQGQLAALNGLLQKHVYWSNLFPKLAEATLKNVSYLAFSADDQGKAALTVTVPGYADLDKFLQVFDLPQFNENFSDVRVASISRSQKGGALETKAEIQFQYNTSLIKKTTPQ